MLTVLAYVRLPADASCTVREDIKPERSLPCLQVLHPLNPF